MKHFFLILLMTCGLTLIGRVDAMGGIAPSDSQDSVGIDVMPQLLVSIDSVNMLLKNNKECRKLLKGLSGTFAFIGKVGRSGNLYFINRNLDICFVPINNKGSWSEVNTINYCLLKCRFGRFKPARKNGVPCCCAIYFCVKITPGATKKELPLATVSNIMVDPCDFIFHTTECDTGYSYSVEDPFAFAAIYFRNSRPVR